MRPYNLLRIKRQIKERGYTMGDMAEIISLYGPQLETFRSELFDLYSKKADILAAREAVRFKYLTNWATRLKSTLNVFAQAIYDTNDEAVISSAGNWVYTFLDIRIPLTDINDKEYKFSFMGKLLEFRQLMPFYSNAGKTVGLLAESSLLISVPVPNQTQTLALKYRSALESIQSASSLVEMNFISPWNFGSERVTYKNIEVFFRNYVAQNVNENVVNTVSTIYHNSGLVEILDEGKSLLTEFMKTTLDLFRVYFAITDKENQVIEFVKSYKGLDDTLANITVSDIMKELEEMVKFNQAQTIKTMMPTATATTTAPSVAAATGPSEAPKSKLNKGLLAAAAAAGVFFLTKE